MKRWMMLLLLVLAALTISARAAEVPRELQEALPEGAEEWMVEDVSGPEGFSRGIAAIAEGVLEEGKDILRSRLRGAASVLLVESFSGGGRAAAFLPMAGGLAVTMLTVGSLDELIGLGSRTIGELDTFSKVLLPTLAAATAASGSVTSATMQQVTTVFLVSLLISLISVFLMPLCCLYIGVLAAGSCLQEARLAAIAEGMKKVITWTLTTALLLFTVYLSVARVITGAADAAAVKVTKAAISGVVPVVGGIIAEASETVLTGAGLLKNTVGVFGMLAILAGCALPFLHLGVQYLLYKLTAFLSAAVGAPWLCKLIDGLGGAFGLVLGMTGSCAVLLLVSVFSFVAAVTP